MRIFSLQETYEQKRTEHLKELQKKEEEMRQMFVVRVKEKEAELKDAEKEVCFRCSVCIVSVYWLHAVVLVIPIWYPSLLYPGC